MATGLPGEVIDVGQVASATNNVPQAASMFSPIMMGVSTAVSLVGNVLNNKAQNKAIEGSISALRSELSFNTGVMKQNMVDTMASNKMSFFSSGLDTNTGTAAQVTMSNNQVLQRNLQHYKENMNQQISNLASQKKSGLGMFF
jgi:hypothetical protein